MAIVVLAAVLFNLISDVTGGVRMTVIDEDLIVAPARRPEADAARRPEAAASAPSSDRTSRLGRRRATVWSPAGALS